VVWSVTNYLFNYIIKFLFVLINLFLNNIVNATLFKINAKASRNKEGVKDIITWKEADWMLMD
jgi:hypothetical protein